MAVADKGLVLVTGATGFIGAHLVARLAAQGWRVRAASRSPADEDPPPGAEPFTCDLTDPDTLAGIEADVDAVVHCAGALGAWGVSDDTLWQVNVDGTTHLLDRFEGRPGVRIVHLSAGGVTGPLTTRTADEQAACAPATLYERTKLEAEREVVGRAREGRVAAVVVRPTFTYGPGDGHKLGLFRAIHKGRYALLDGGTNLLHPVYIDDLLAGILLAMERGEPGQVYILGGPRPVTTRELADEIADALGVRRPWLSIPTWLAGTVSPVSEALGRLLSIQPMLTGSRVLMMSSDYGYRIDRARQALGYEPQTDLRTGIRATVHDYRSRGLL